MHLKLFLLTPNLDRVGQVLQKIAVLRVIRVLEVVHEVGLQLLHSIYDSFGVLTLLLLRGRWHKDVVHRQTFGENTATRYELSQGADVGENCPLSLV